MDSNIVEKIQKLLRLAESSNVHEAALAAARATEMMVKHQIDLATVEAHDGALQEAVEQHELARGTKQRVLWRGCLANGIARAWGCRIFWHWTQKGQCWTIQFVGRRSDLDACSYLYGYLGREIERLADDGWDTTGQWESEQPRTWKDSFRKGAASEIANRVQAQRAETLRAERTAHAESTALVVIQRHESQVEAYIEKLDLNPGRRLGVGSGDGYQAGRRAGASVNIGGGGRGIAAPARQLH